MDGNRWPRPGPGMVVLFAVVGLIAGILGGLLDSAGSNQGPGQAAGQQDGAQTTTQAPLPARFYTVVLASIPRDRGRPVAEARAQRFRTEGVDPVGVLDPRRYSSLNDHWAVYSGVFETEDQARQHRDDLHERFPDLSGAYPKHVRSES